MGKWKWLGFVATITCAALAVGAIAFFGFGLSLGLALGAAAVAAALVTSGGGVMELNNRKERREQQQLLLDIEKKSDSTIQDNKRLTTENKLLTGKASTYQQIFEELNKQLKASMNEKQKIQSSVVELEKEVHELKEHQLDQEEASFERPKEDEEIVSTVAAVDRQDMIRKAI